MNREEPSVNPVDFDRLKRLIGNNRKMEDMIISDFLQAAVGETERLGLYIGNADWPASARLSHALMGRIGYLDDSENTLCRLFKETELACLKGGTGALETFRKLKQRVDVIRSCLEGYLDNRDSGTGPSKKPIA
jgi:hypothetical protein